MAVNRTEERIELTAIDRASPAINQVGQAFGGLRTGMDAFKTALLAIGSTVGAGAMLQFAQDTIKATAALGNMATATGASVENLSRLQAVAKIGGHDFEGLTGAIGNLIKNLKTSNEEEKVAAHALEFLGIKAKDANGRFRDTVEILADVAKALSRYEDGGNKVALVQDLLGKSAAAYLPLLKDIGETGLGAAKRTKEQAEQADALEKNINRLTAALSASKTEMMLGFIPALNEVTERLVKASQEGRLTSQAFLEVLKAGGGSVTGLGLMGGWLGQKAAGFLEGERERYRGGPDLWAIARRQMAGDAHPWGTSVADWMEPGPANTLNYNSPNLKKGPAAKDDFTPMMRQIEERIALLQAENTASEKLTETQKQMVKIRIDIAKGYVDLKPHQVAAIEAALKTAEAEDQVRQVQETRAAAEKRLADEQQQRLNTQLQSVEAMERENRSLAEQIEEIGLTTEQVGMLRAARLDDLAAQKEAELVNLRRTAQGAAEIAVLEDEIALLRERASLTREHAGRTVSVERLRAAEEASRRLQENLERGLTDATIEGLTAGFRRGESVAENFLRTLESMFKSAVLTPLIQPLIRPVANAVSGAIGGIGNGGGMPSIPGLDWSGVFGNSGMLASGASVGAFGEVAALTASTEIAALGGSAAGAAAGGLSIGAALPWVGAGLLALNLLGGDDLFGGGGGPKPSDVGLLRTGGGLSFTQNNVTDSGWGEAYAQQFETRYAALSPESRALIDAHGGSSWSAGGPASAQSLVSQYVEPLLRQAEEHEASMKKQAEAAAAEAARQAAALAEQAAAFAASMDEMRHAIRAAQDPLGYWTAQVGTIGARLKSSADTVEEWRAEFLAALEGPMTEAQFARWQAFGDAITRATEAAADAARTELELTEARVRAEEAAAEAAARAEAERDAAFARLVGQRDTLLGQESGIAGSLRGAVSGLSGRLGIDSLQGGLASLATSEYRLPTQRFAAARTQLDAAFASASGGDLSAVQSFPALLQSTLGLAREVYASGPEFQQIFAEGNRMLGELLERQRGEQAQILKSVPDTIVDAANDQIAELRAGFASTVAELRSVREQLAEVTAAIETSREPEPVGR